MKRIIERATVALHLSAEREEEVRTAFGPEHPFTRAVARQRTVAFQIVATAIVVSLGVAGVVTRPGGDATMVLVVGSLVGAALVLYSLSARTVVRENADELIAEGRDGVSVEVLAHERRRLSSRALRESLARSLERHLRDAERWLEIVPHYRPPRGLRYLRFHAATVRDVARLLRSDSAQVRGVAATARFVHGHSSPLFDGDVEMLDRELQRLRSLLSPGEPELQLVA
ncbi:MAG TPA: hypothetical protein VFK76_11420 [Gaiellaceae bacterium]|nr:hypothetical protein [Gaiellaceae bacterium]